MVEVIGRQRYKIGFLFNFSIHWMGGIVYIINLVKTLDFLDDKDKPEVFLFYKPGLIKVVDEINYPYLNKIEWNFPSVYKGYLLSWVLGKNVFVSGILKKYNLDGLYPLFDFPVRSGTNTKMVGWYADLQHKYYPEFFTRRKIIERNARIRLMLRNSLDQVVSSQAVADDFASFFKIKKSLKLHIFHFVSVIDDISKTDIQDLISKYTLPQRYFIISNQFHKHKNHIVLLKAIALLKERGVKIHLLFTGKFPDETNSHYINELKEFIEVKQLENQISFLGVIPRLEQLVLMKYSRAVIQPSLFEGWSTVIEDARSLQVPVIASDIPVNIEQLGQDGIYFNPYDDIKLARILESFRDREITDVFYREYSVRVREAALSFMRVFRN